MLKRSYDPLERNEKTLQLGEKVTSLIVGSNVTYKEAVDALEIALSMLETKARLSIDQVLPQADSELKP